MGTCPNCGLWEGSHVSGEWCRCNDAPPPDFYKQLEDDYWNGAQPMMDKYDNAALNLMGWAEVRCEPAGASGAFWCVAGPRRASRNVAESDIATMRRSIADYMRSACAEANRQRDAANEEVVRLRKALNTIAWPAHFGLSVAQATPEMYRKIASDTLAIGGAQAARDAEKENGK